MKYLWRVAICCASTLALNTGWYAIGESSNPYEAIVTRNIFDLNPPRPVTPMAPQPPVKITPDGIMTIFGAPQVLFNVAIPPHPPKPATQKSYILSVGQEQDGIEVKHIDEKSGVITFNNHGMMQDIPLVKAPPITTPPVVMAKAPNTFNRNRFQNHPPQPKLSPEERMIMIAAEKARAKQEGNPTWKIFPPTPLDKDAGTVNTSPGVPPEQ